MGEGGFEPPKPKQQIYSLPHLTALELSHIKLLWSWWTDLNPRPADYKSAALPTELHQPTVPSQLPDDLFMIPQAEHFVKCFLKICKKEITIFFRQFQKRFSADFPEMMIRDILPGSPAYIFSVTGYVPRRRPQGFPRGSLLMIQSVLIFRINVQAAGRTGYLKCEGMTLSSGPVPLSSEKP